MKQEDDHPAPRGALLYGEPGTCHVWEHTTTGRKRWDFDDEYLAMQCAVRIGSVVEANGGEEPCERASMPVGDFPKNG